MRTDQAKAVFSYLMKRAQRVRLTAAQREKLSQARQLLRRRARPAMNPADLFGDAPPLIFEEGESRPRLARSAKEALTLAGRGRRPELLKEGREFDESRLISSPLFQGRGGKQGLLQENRAPKFSELVDARLQQMADTFDSGVTETTGRLVHAGGDQYGGRDVVRRLGGAKPAYRELRHESAGPQAIAAAIHRGHGRVYDRIRQEVEAEFIRAGYGPARKRKRGRLTVAAHKALRKYCRHCKTQHAKGEHRFHGAGAYHRTHLFSFNPRRRQRVGRIVEIRYERDWGRQPGYYKHVFRVPASIYRMPDNSIVIE